ncbi:MAG: AAA domain-containing protein [Polyangiales bacterium]
MNDRGPSAAEQTPLAPFDPEALRVPAERTLSERLRAVPGYAEAAERVDPPPADVLRRALMANSVRLSEAMAPETWSVAHAARDALRIDKPLEIYQCSGRENAAIHLIEEPVVLQVMGRFVNLLDRGAALAAFGHEFGHYLAHGPWTELGRLGAVAGSFLSDEAAPPELVRLAAPLSMCQELTADRFGLLACRDLAAHLRLEMICATGLSGDALTWDTDAYLLQCRELVEGVLQRGDTARGGTHPEHGVRAWAAWLFSETREFHAITGHGPATRALADVNAEVERVLALPSLDARWHMFDAPPPELDECALAGCVLVAAADGEVSELEVDTLERAFSKRVAEYAKYLDPEFARARLVEVAPVVKAAGEDVLRAVFLMLMRVCAADGLLYDTEIDAVMRIGDALDARSLFERLMSATLRVTRRVERAHDEVAPAPLPPRRGEAAEAIRVYLHGVRRRGGGSVTLRRVLRLVGAERADDEVLRKLDEELRFAGVTMTPPPGEGELDEARALEVIEAAAPQGVTARAARRDPALLPAERAKILRAVSALRDELVSGDGRSASVRLRAPRAGRAMDLMDLDALSTGLGERALTQVREGRRARLVEASEAGTHEGGRRAASSLLALDRAARQREDDTGRRDLAVGHPFLCGVVEGYLVRGPVVLHPVTLERDARGARGFTLAPASDEGPEVNVALLRLVFSKRGQAFTEALAASLDEAASDPARSVEAVLETLAQVGLNATRSPSALTPFRSRDVELDAWSGNRLELEECAVLGFFPQSSSDLLQDYDALVASIADPSAELGAALGCAATLLPAEMRAAVAPEEPAEGSVEADPLGPVLYADPSQRAVLARAATARALVVDGPPGTGKSQVIVNLVADAIARGERVAVVCEKRAALDVVAQRAQAVGLRHALALVHDVHDDRRALYTQIAARIEESEARTFDESEGARAVEARDRVRASLEERAASLAAQGDGTTLRVGQLHALASAVEVTLDAAPVAMREVTEAALDPLGDALVALWPYADLYVPGQRWSAMARPSFGDLDGRGVTSLGERLAQAQSAAEVLAERSAASPVPAAVVARAEAALGEAMAFCDGAATLPAAILLPMVHGVAGEPQALGLAHDALTRWREHGATLAQINARVVFALPAEAQQAAEVLSSWQGRLGRFLEGTWWTAKRTLRAHLAQSWPERAAADFDAPFLDSLRVRSELAAAWRALDAALDALHLGHLRPADAQGAVPLLQAVEPLLPYAQRAAAMRPALEPVGGWLDPRGNMVPWRATLASLRELAVAFGRYHASVEALGGRFPWLGAQPSAALLGATREAWLADGPRLVEGDRRMAAARAHVSDPAAVLHVLHTARPDATPHTVRALTVKAWARARIAAAEARDPGLARRDAPTPWGGDDATGARLTEGYDRTMALSAQRVLARLDDAALLRATPALRGRRRTGDQAAREAMLKECRKQRSVMPLRGFVRRFAAEGLLDVLPVWLLSPETISVLFAQAPLFDLVVFDEASQCTVESGLPVLLRARRAMVVGDEKQMPPTSFFESAGPGESDDAAPEERVAREVLDAESLLSLARTRWERVGLSWHYRCRYEELIAFSNHAMYDGALRTVPSTASASAPPALRWVAVPEGRYDAGRNVPEAEAVVDTLRELLAAEDAPSVGVVTFNLPQRGAILDAVDARRASDPDFALSWERATARERLDDRPFVKNLESVQGDERDVIVFSTGHAPVERAVKGRPAERYVPARFGPLGLRGGERRLNVAVSRARLSCVVVSSFEPTMLSTAGAQHAGPALFKVFLEYAWHLSEGRRAQAAALLTRPGGVVRRAGAKEPTVRGWLPLRVQVAAALQSLGLQTELELGSSDARVPLAVMDPKDPTRFRLAVLCEDGSGDGDVFARWVHTPRVLAMRGWRVITVDARRWDTQRQAVLAELLAAVGEGA